MAPLVRLPHAMSQEREAELAVAIALVCGAGPADGSWYDMWRQGFPENEKSPEGLVLVHTFRDALASCLRGNVVAIISLLLLLTVFGVGREMRDFMCICLMANSFAVWSNVYWIPRAERTHGILYAHRVFARISVINVILTFGVAIPTYTVHLRSHGPAHAYDAASQGSPLHCVMLSGLALVLVGAVHLATIPLKYRAAMHASMVVTTVTAPCYSMLGHAQETLIVLVALALGEVLGMTVKTQGPQCPQSPPHVRTHLTAARLHWCVVQVQRMIRRSFTATRAAQDAQQRLTSRMEEIDAEKERLTSRLEQIGRAARVARLRHMTSS